MRHVAVLSFEIFIPAAQSLKEKRRIVKSIKDRIRSHYNVSVAELDGLDKWQKAVIGVCMIGNDKAYMDGCLQKVKNFLEGMDGFNLIDLQVEFL